MKSKKLLRRRSVPKDVAERDHVAVQLPKNMTQVFTGVWSWKVDGPCLGVVVLAVWLDRYMDPSVPKEILNLLALFALGYILKRNLRRDVKFRHLKVALRDSQMNPQGRFAQWFGKARGSHNDSGR
ncbi:hypothetical protein [Paraburkholderia youngii]|uniref:hypothetical protein n=1 Tax=Paraburkholderia youngii TaxID=2782701 RepID=UPI003D1DD490